MNAAAQEQALPAWIMRLKATSGSAIELSCLLVRVMLVGIEYPGCINAEITPAQDNDQSEWVLIQRYSDASRLQAWEDSAELKRLLDDISTDLAQNNFTVEQQHIDSYVPTANVATAIVTHVKPGKEDDYRLWVSRIHKAQAESPGYRGTFFQPPTGPKAPWTTLLRFDSTKSLDGWFDSPVRAELLEEAKEMAWSDVQRLTAAFPGWFPQDLSGKGAPPWKMAMLVLLVLYPTLIVLNMFLSPILNPLGFPASLFISNVISCAVLSYALMPMATRVFKFFLLPSGHNPAGETLKGVLIIFAMYAIEVVLALNVQ